MEAALPHSWPILSLLIFSPIVGVAFLLLMQGGSEQATRNAKFTALWTSLVSFAVSIWLWVRFDPTSDDFQFVEYIPWFEGYHITYFLGVDGISLFFILLTTFLTPICILVSWHSITQRVREYLIAFLLLEALLIGVFCALDFVLFYLFFEAMLIPMFLIIGVWGGDRRVYAAFKFFLYTLLGSVLLLVAILYAYSFAGTTSVPVLMEELPKLSPEVQNWLWLALFASFAVKVPMWPVHTWLPDAHVQAPTAGSVMLAGVLLKLGGYGFLRFSLPMLPEASHYFADFVFALSVAAVVITSLIALMQEDMKKLIAYSSIAHMGFVTIGIFTFNTEGIAGSIMQMISHGLVSAALFMCVGVVYDRVHSREIARYGGLVHRMPVYAFVFLFFTLASAGLPGLSGFVGEILVLLGAFKVSSWVAAGAATGMVLGAAYGLWLYRRVIFGELEKSDLKDILDLDRREILTFAPIVALVLFLGIYPAPILHTIEPSVAKLVNQVNLNGLNQLPDLEEEPLSGGMDMIPEEGEWSEEIGKDEPQPEPVVYELEKTDEAALPDTSLQNNAGEAEISTPELQDNAPAEDTELPADNISEDTESEATVDDGVNTDNAGEPTNE